MHKNNYRVDNLLKYLKKNYTHSGKQDTQVAKETELKNRTNNN